MLTFKFGVAVIVLAAALSVPAYAANKGGGGGGGHGGGGGGGGHAAGGGGHAVGGGGRGGGARVGGGGAHHVSARPATSRSAAHPSSRGTRASAAHNASNARTSTSAAGQKTLFNSTGNATRSANVKSTGVRSTLNSRSVAGALRNTSALRDPRNRSQITATAATAGWRNGRDGGNGWWRHSNGGYGWVGPLYWPFAYYDMYDYAFWGYGYDDSFWGYGYGDIFAGIFAPYGYDDLTGYLPRYASGNPGDQTALASGAAPDQLAQMCGADTRDIAGLPIDQFQQTMQLTDAQRAALDDLAAASAKAAQNIKAACPADVALTAPSRLAAMQQRIEAMIAAVDIVQPPLEKFYGLLSDEQKARLTALGNDQRQSKTTDQTAGTLAQNCGAAAQPGVMEWPTAAIDQTVRPTDAQGASLTALQNATTQAADLLKASCLSSDPLTPPARLAAVGKRLATMLQAVKMVNVALNDFYATLSDEQKARFEAIGPQRTAQLESLEVAPTEAPKYRRGIPGPEQIIRRLLSPL
jgi:LTXXQ motif family protein